MATPKDACHCVLCVKVIPRSSRNQIAGKEGEVYRVKITAPPVEGAANKALRDFLARKLGVPKREVEILSGAHARTKRIRVTGLGQEAAHRMLTA